MSCWLREAERIPTKSTRLPGAETGQSSLHINNTGAWRKSVWWSAGGIEPTHQSDSGSVLLSHSLRLSGLSSSLAEEA